MIYEIAKQFRFLLCRKSGKDISPLGLLECEIDKGFG
jgi:hypothetical protein